MFSALLLLACTGLPLSTARTPPLVLSDINLVVTTDLHSWIEGRRHEEHLNATLGHVISFVEKLRELGKQGKHDVFLLDNGDINDGTGLSGLAADHVAYLAPLMQQAPYDALNVGNHELYSRDGHGAIGGPACPIVGLKDAGFIDGWKGRYLSSNIIWTETGQPVGSRYAVLTGHFGTRLLVFGFLYNMQDHCDKVDVENVSEVVQADWFQSALQEHGREADAVVALFHIDYEDPLVDLVAAAIRARIGEEKPLQVIAGHSHIRGWRRLDGFASVYEPGCKLDTLGFISFPKHAAPPDQLEKTGLPIHYSDLDGNTAIIASSINTSTGALLTQAGKDFMAALKHTQETLHLNDTLGCAARHYKVRGPLGQPDSLWTFYMNTVLPGELFDPKSSRPQWSLVGVGALVYDVYSGPFTPDDAYKVSPFGNFWFAVQNISGETLVTLITRLNGQTHVNHKHPGVSARLPNYVGSGVPSSALQYDFIYCDFDAPAVETELGRLLGSIPAHTVYRPSSNTSSVLVDWFASQSCPTSGSGASEPATIILS